MSFETFCDKVIALVKKAGGGIAVKFSNDEEAGRFSAACSDGTVITGNPTSLRVSVRFGSGHLAMASI